MRVSARETIVCIGCPLGCRVTVSVNEKGKITGMKGAECKQGEKYVASEFEAPVRTLTATVRTSSERYPLLPVRTSSPVPRSCLMDIMRKTAEIEVESPVETGEVVAEDILGTGTDLIATSDWPREPGS